MPQKPRKPHLQCGFFVSRPVSSRKARISAHYFHELGQLHRGVLQAEIRGHVEVSDDGCEFAEITGCYPQLPPELHDVVDVVDVHRFDHGRLAGRFRQLLELLLGGVDGLAHAREAAFELDGRGYGRHPYGPDGRREGKQGLAGLGHLLPDGLELPAHGLQLHRGDASQLPVLVAQGLQLRLGAGYLALQVAVLLLGGLHLAGVYLALRLLERVQLALGLDDGRREQLLLLREEFHARRVELEEARDPLQLGLGFFNG